MRRAARGMRGWQPGSGRVVDSAADGAAAQQCRGTEEGDGMIYSSCLAGRVERQELIAHGEWYCQKEQMAIFRVTGKYFK